MHELRTILCINLLIGRETSATKLYRVVGCVIHPNYVPSFYNDIAVCKIAGVITYSAQVGPVCLPFRPINVPAVTALGQYLYFADYI